MQPLRKCKQLREMKSLFGTCFVLRRVELGLPLEEWGRFGEDFELGITKAMRSVAEGKKSKVNLAEIPEAQNAEEEEAWKHWACDSSVMEVPAYGGEFLLLPLAFTPHLSFM